MSKVYCSHSINQIPQLKHNNVINCQPNFAVWYKEWNYGTFVWALPVCGRAAMTLGIGPHSSFFVNLKTLFKY